MDVSTLETLLRGVSFHKTKAKNLIASAKMILNEFHGDIPNTVDALLRLPGVGPKMAFLCMQCAWGVNCGVGVDTHVHRVLNRWGWVESKETEREVTRRVILFFLIPNIYSLIHFLIINTVIICLCLLLFL